jgi:uncharacterized repeat protein (TIGR03803 family)
MSLCIIVLSACSTRTAGGLPAVPDASGQSVVRQASPDVGTFVSLYSFKSVPDGAFPLAPLALVNGVLYGTTNQGGTVTADGEGTVFKITPGGSETVLHSFTGNPDGELPQAGLTAVNGVFYGTTASGGADSGGAVFTITKTGVENIVYSFTGGSDGTGPTAALTAIKGTLYGTTIGGGGGPCASGFGCGTVFKIDPAGTETVLHRFQGGSDGQAPAAGFTIVNGTLYGTTFFGGGSGCNGKGCGTIYKVDPSGSTTVVYAFKGGADGANPDAGLLNVGGTLYGTTSDGGGKPNRGTIFNVSTSGTETVLHRFKGLDGADPEAGLVSVGGTLYGTTFAGGRKSLGTIFSITPAGSFTRLHSFSGTADGSNPSATLSAVTGTLYGTTKTGGNAGGFGTIFSLKP